MHDRLGLPYKLTNYLIRMTDGRFGFLHFGDNQRQMLIYIVPLPFYYALSVLEDHNTAKTCLLATKK